MSGFMPLASRIENDLVKAIAGLAARLQVESVVAESHIVLRATGISHSPDCMHHLAVFCVGQIASAIQFNLEIRADLLEDDEYSLEHFEADVTSVIGQDNHSLTLKEKRDERDPWLFEAVSHLLVYLSSHNSLFLPVGEVICLSMVHGNVKEKGLDLIAIYGDESIGLGIGESKAWENDPSGGLRDAAGTFRKVDLGDYDPDIRKIVNQMRYSVSDDRQSQITGAFWRHERAYLPFICYESGSSAPRWNSRRDALKLLEVPTSHKVLFPIPITRLRGFFDQLADAMRAYVAEIRTIN